MTKCDPTSPHCVAVIGGAVAGAAIAGHLSQLGVKVAVFEQNPRPFGKIEDGLPRWHHRLREREYKVIREKLSRENVLFVPNTRIGRDIAFSDLVNDWGFSAVILANGAWRDRPLPIDGADAYVGKGLIYQNAFVTWYNHLEETGYEGPEFEILDDTIVVGGGLASIDVAKILMLETTRAKLAERGIEVPMLELEVRGIPKILAAHDLEFEDLELAGCTIFYRRHITDMPLVPLPPNPTSDQLEKTQRSRQTLLDKAIRKFCFKIEPLLAPDELIVEDGRLVGIEFRRTRIEGGRVYLTDETFEKRGAAVISSIGSTPEPIDGIEMKGELFNFSDWEFGRLRAYRTVFSVGNVVTGKGNIAASRKHAEYVASEAIEAFLGVCEDPAAAREKPENTVEIEAHEIAGKIADELSATDAPDPASLAATLARVEQSQKKVGYPSALDVWLESVAPKQR